jgi:hypothetical protein
VPPEPSSVPEASAALVDRATPLDPIDVPTASDDQTASEPEFRIPKKRLLWPAPIAFAAAGLTAWLAAAHWEKVAFAVEHAKLQFGGVATLATERFSPTADRVVVALRTATDELASRVLPRQKVEPTAVPSATEDARYSAPSTTSGTGIEAASLSSKVSETRANKDELDAGKPDTTQVTVPRDPSESRR